MQITQGKVTLRDYAASDIDDEIRWMNTDNDWFYADTPWETPVPADPEELRREMLGIMAGLKEDSIRWRLEIEADGRHVGMVSSYLLDGSFEPVPWEQTDPAKNAAENHAVRALGIEICEKEFRGRGIGAAALTAFMEYYQSFGEDRFLLETWSGNERMLGCARKLGFAEVKRRKGAYTVDGEKADAVILEKRFGERKEN